MLNRSPVIDMRNEILNFIAQETYGESFRATRVELDTNSDAPIEYDSPPGIVVTTNGETRPTKKPVPLKKRADDISASGLQILSCFLDGTRRVYKVDDISYGTGTRKKIYPIVAAQVSVGCCRRVEKKLHAESFSDEIILVLPDTANFDGQKNSGRSQKTFSPTIRLVAMTAMRSFVEESFNAKIIFAKILPRSKSPIFCSV